MISAHILKCHREPFQAICEGRKTHETRKEDDRKYSEGDFLLLREWHEVENRYTGRAEWRRVTCLSRGPQWNLPAEVVVMSIRALDDKERFDAHEWLKARRHL